MSGHAARIARDHCLAPERVDAPIVALERQRLGSQDNGQTLAGLDPSGCG